MIKGKNTEEIRKQRCTELPEVLVRTLGNLVLERLGVSYCRVLVGFTLFPQTCRGTTLMKDEQGWYVFSS